MNNKTLTILMGFPISAILLGTAFSGKEQLLGLLIGYLTGVLNIQWLFRDTRQVMERNVKAALRKYNISLFSRLGMITAVVLIVSRFKPDWTYYLALGIIAGVLIPMAVIIKQLIRREGGEP